MKWFWLLPALAGLRDPQLAVSPGSLVFSAPYLGPNPEPQPLLIRNTGDGKEKLVWQAVDDAPWLALNPAGGQVKAGLAQQVVVSVDVKDLGVGTHRARIDVSASGNAGGPFRVDVELTVSALPALGVAPASLAFSAPEGGPNPAAQTLTVRNDGGGLLTWQAADDAGWLSVSPGSGTLGAGASQALTVAVASASLGPGAVSGTITVTSSAPTDGTRTVGVDLTVNRKATIDLAPAALAFSAAENGANPPPRSATLRNTGGETLEWSLTDDGPWLSASPERGSLAPGLAQEITVAVDSDGLTDGTYTASITFTAATASNSPRPLPVTLDVSGLPVVSVTPARLDFLGSGAAPLSVTNAGAGTLKWNAADDASWLSVSPAYGTLDAVQSQPLTVTADAAGLAPGLHTALLTVSDGASANGSQTVFVQLEVPRVAPSSEQHAGGCGLLGAEVLLLLLLSRAKP